MAQSGKKLAEYKIWHRHKMAFLTEAANRGSVSTGPVEHDIDNSCKFEADNGESLSRTPSSAGDRKTWTLSFWLKRTEFGATMRVLSLIHI